MKLYLFWDNDDNWFVYSSFRKAISGRAALYSARSKRPEIMQVDIGKLDKAKACALLMRRNYAKTIRDIA